MMNEVIGGIELAPTLIDSSLHQLPGDRERGYPALAAAASSLPPATRRICNRTVIPLVRKSSGTIEGKPLAFAHVLAGASYHLNSRHLDRQSPLMQ